MFSLLFVAAATAAPCGPTAQARMTTAEDLVANLTTLEVDEQLNSVQRARDILERTAKDFPRCRAASRKSNEVRAIAIRIRPAAEAAAQNKAIERMGRRLGMLETEASPNRDQVRHMVRSVSALQSRYPGDERIEELTYRLALLGGTR